MQDQFVRSVNSAALTQIGEYDLCNQTHGVFTINSSTTLAVVVIHE